MNPKIHELKTLSGFFDNLSSGIKTFEIRKNDRDFKLGDTLFLREWDGSEYSGNGLFVRVEYITDFEQKAGFVVMAIKRL